MKVKVLLPFRDKDCFTRLYTPGETLDFEEERANHIVELGLAEPAEEPQEAPKPDEAPKKKPRKKKAE